MNEIKVRLPKPHPGQLEVLSSNARWKVLMCGRRWGKSLICQIISIQRMLAGKHVAYICPTHELGRIFYQAILQFLPPEIIESDNQTDRKIELVTGGSIKFFSGEALDSFRGLKFHTVIVDEAAFIPDLKTAWNTAIRPTLTDYEGDAIWISTPNGKDYFHSWYLRGVNKESGYQSFHFTSFDNPTLPVGEVDAMRAEMTEAQFNQEILAIAGENSSSAFGGSDVINKNVITTLSSNPTVSIGIDVASYQDWTVFIGLDRDGNMTFFDRFQKDWTTTMDRISKLPSDVYKVMDATGGGAVAYEQLQRTVKNLHPFVFTSQSKIELMTKLIKDVEEGKVKYNQTTADEMSVFQYKRTATGHYKYEAKSGYHDDAVCALALANNHRKNAIQQAKWKLYSR